MVAVSALDVPKESPFRNLDQIPYPEPPPPPPPIQNLARAEDEDSQSIRALVEEIDSHAELIDLEITSNPTGAQGQTQPQLPEPNLQFVVDTTLIQPNNRRTQPFEL